MMNRIRKRTDQLTTGIITSKILKKIYFLEYMVYLWRE